MGATKQVEQLASAPAPPMVETAGRITALDSYRTYQVGIPESDGWILTSRLADASVASSWYEEVVERLGDRRMAASALGRSVASTATLVWLYPVFAESRLPLCSIDETVVRRHEQGWIDAVAVASERVALLPGDPASGMPNVELVADREALFDALAEKLIEVEPLFAAVRGVGGIGWAALWGELADQIAAGALWIARLLERDRWSAWRDAEAILDRLAARQEKMRVRPRPFPVSWSGGEELFAVRGTCCLHYRKERPNQEGKGYCSTCPLQSDEWRTPRLQAYLEGNPAE